MFRLFDRYILKEILPPFLIGVMAYTFVLLMNQILVFAELFIARGVSLVTVLRLFAFMLPALLAFTIPMSVLLGILAGLSRMSSDTEVTALKTLGIGFGRLLRPLLLFALCGWLATSFLTLFLAPRANHRWVQIFVQDVLKKVRFDISPREFNESIPLTTIYVQDINRDGMWKNIFVYRAESAREPRVIFAREGQLVYDTRQQQAFLELWDGSIHSTPSANATKYSVTTFERFEEALDMETIYASVSSRKRVREKDIRELITDVGTLRREKQSLSAGPSSLEFQRNKRDYASHWVEIHKKFAIPLACFIFAVLGLPLGAYTKKGGRTSGFTLSIGIILVYYVLITAGEQLAMGGRLSPWVGIWGPDILMSLAAGLFFLVALRETSALPGFLRILPKDRSRAPARRRGSVSGRWRPSLPFPNIIDRYILRKFVFIFTLAFVSTLAIYIIVTFFERIDTVYEFNKPLSLFFVYIWHSIPDFVNNILPVTALIATLLCLGLLTKSNEITALKACGVSLYRVVLPVLLAGLLLSFFSFYLQENVIPYSNRKAEQTWDRIRDIPPRTYTPLDRKWVMNRSRNLIYHYQFIDPDTGSFSSLSILEIDPSAWTLKKRIYADKADFEGGEMVLTGCWVRTFDNGLPVDFAEARKMVYESEEDKSYFLTEWKEAAMMNYAELRRYIRDIERRNFETTRFKVKLDFKLAFPLAGLIMVLFGIPFSFSMGRRGALVGLGLSLLVGMVYWGMIGIFRSLGYVGYLPPVLAAWGPNLVFGLAGLYLLMTMRT